MTWGNVAGAAVGVVGGYLANRGSRSGSVPSSSMQVQEPWGPQQQYLLDIFGRAQAQSQLPTLGAQSPYTREAIERMGARGGAPTPLIGAARGQIGDTLGGRYLDVGSNPYLSGAVQLGLDQARRNVSAAVGPEGFGSSAHQGWLMEQGSKYAAPIYAGQYAQERQNQISAAGMAPGLEYADLPSIGLLGQAGGLQEARSQAEVDQPWTGLQRYGALVAGQYGGTSAGTSESPYFYNPWANMLGGAAGAYSLYDRIRRGQSGGGGGGGTVYQPDYGTPYGSPGSMYE